jgi:hypothetical protein
MLSEYLVDRLNKVQRDTGEINISKNNINKINTAVMQDEIQDEILTGRALIENSSSEKTLSEKILNEEIFTDGSWLTYMKNYAEQTEQESQLRTLLQKIEDTLLIDSQHKEIRHTIEKSMRENRNYQSDELTYNTESLKAELRYLLENSEISKSFMERFENTEEVLTAANAKSGQYMTENEVTLTQITELLEYRTDIQGYLRQTYYADDIKNSRYQMYAGDVVEKNRYQSLLQGDLSYQYVGSSEEYFENSKASGEIQYALSPGENEGAVNERVEKQLGDVKQKLEQITRNVNKLNSVQAGMKEEFIRKNDMVSFRKELLNHLEEDISTAGKRQGILH